MSTKILVKEYIFYTTEGITLQPDLGEGAGDVENCQILGWAKGCDPATAFESLASECPWLCDTTFREVIASELRDSKNYYFDLKSVSTK